MWAALAPSRRSPRSDVRAPYLVAKRWSHPPLHPSPTSNTRSSSIARAASSSKSAEGRDLGHAGLQKGPRDLQGRGHSSARFVHPTALRPSAAAVSGDLSGRADPANPRHRLLACGWESSRRAFTTQGIRVLSWDAFARAPSDRRTCLPTRAGRQLRGGHRLRLQQPRCFPGEGGAEGGASFKYFESNAKGDRGTPLALDDATRAQFREFAKSTTGGDIVANQVIALSSSLDSTGIVTTTGESIWFYRRTVTIPTTTQQGMRFLFARLENNAWTPAKPEIPEPLAIAAPTRMQERKTSPGDPGVGLAGRLCSRAPRFDSRRGQRFRHEVSERSQMNSVKRVASLTIALSEPCSFSLPAPFSRRGNRRRTSRPDRRKRGISRLLCPGTSRRLGRPLPHPSRPRRRRSTRTFT